MHARSKARLPVSVHKRWTKAKDGIHTAAVGTDYPFVGTEPPGNEKIDRGSIAIVLAAFPGGQKLQELK